MQKRAELDAQGIVTDFARFQIQHVCKDGRVIWGEILSKPERNEKGEITGYHGITREITEQKLLQEQIESLAFYDALTKLPNRLLLTERLSQVLLNSKREHHYSAVMFLDLDNFKSLNDTYGHSVGNLLLCQVAKRLKQCVREVDTVARFGGDEFVVILNSLDKDKGASVRYARGVAEKISKSLSAFYTLTIQECWCDICVRQALVSLSLMLKRTVKITYSNMPIQRCIKPKKQVKIRFVCGRIDEDNRTHFTRVWQFWSGALAELLGA